MMLCSLAWAVPGCLFVSKLRREEIQTCSLIVQLAQPGFIMNCRCNILLISALQRLSKSRGQDQMVESNRADLDRKKGRNNQALWSKFITMLLWVILCVKTILGISTLLWKLMHLRKNWKHGANTFLDRGGISSTCCLRTHDLPNPAAKLSTGAVTAGLTEFMLKCSFSY